jgi:annexin A7/11
MSNYPQPGYSAGSGFPPYQNPTGPMMPPGGGYPAYQQPGFPGGPPGAYPGGMPPGQPTYPGGMPHGQPTYPGGMPPGQPTHPGGMPPGQPTYPGGMPPGQPTYPGGYPAYQQPGFPGGPPAAYPGGMPVTQPAGFPSQNYGAMGPGQYQQPGGMWPGYTGAIPTTTMGYPRGTIRPYPNFNPEADCNQLRKAMKGIGTDEQAIIQVLGRRSSSQRLQIKATYQNLFHKDLIQDLKSELSGRFEDLVIALMVEPAIYDAQSLNKAMRGLGTKESLLTEILCSRTNAEIQSIKMAYQREFSADLEQVVRSETSGCYQRVLMACLQGQRNELNPQQMQMVMTHGPQAIVDRAQAQYEAQELYRAGEKRLGTDESCFIRILCSRNIYQLKAIFEEYQKVTGKDILASIDSEMSGDLADALKSIALCQSNRPLYFAKRLQSAMAGAGTSDNTLIRIVVTRSEIDLADIKTEYFKNFGKTLEEAILSETSGDYKKMLIAVIAGN